MMVEGLPRATPRAAGATLTFSVAPAVGGAHGAAHARRGARVARPRRGGRVVPEARLPVAQ
ncbi:4'-phosphopantetheinyl transferase superfamily protein [Burkholderia mallei PRL-20]|nr:4'-phosphopantetheinyl transferase superfamily protein [Burkholderia mallei PRL-20]